MTSSPFDLPRAFGGPFGLGVIRQLPGDFVVDEIPLVEPDGSGEHLLLRVRKRGQNSEWVARQLARFAGVRPRDISYAGTKDRHAVASQWFSLHLPGREDPDFSQFELEGVELLEQHRHGRKLRRGALKGNHFSLRVRDVKGDRGAIETALGRISRDGFPNYFGAQRFGRNGENLEGARRLFAGERRRLSRNQRGFYLSAARSWLFNQVLAERVREGSWKRILAGEWLQLDGRRGGFRAEPGDAELTDRLAAGEIHPSGPLWGRGEVQVSVSALAVENQVIEANPELAQGLERASLEQERRALRVLVPDLEWRWDEADLLLQFSLPKGSFATALLAELFDLVDASGSGGAGEDSDGDQ